jgi:hypothetical protein
VYDAVAQTTTNYTVAKTGSLVSNATDLYIGSRIDGHLLTRFNGRIAQVRMWKNLALSDAAVDLVRWYQNDLRVGGLSQRGFYLPLLGTSPEPDYNAAAGGAKHPGTVSGATVGDHAPVGPWFAPDDWGWGAYLGKMGTLKFYDGAAWKTKDLDGALKITGEEFEVYPSPSAEGRLRVYDPAIGDWRTVK